MIYISVKTNTEPLFKISISLLFTFPILLGTGYAVFLLFKPILIKISQIDNPYIKIMQGWYKKMTEGNQTSKNSKEYPKINSKDYNTAKRNR